MQREYHRLCQRYHEYEQQGLQLDLSRGKPAPEQLALSQRMLGELNSRSVLDSEDGTDCRNYGGLDGIPEAKALLAGMIGARPEQVMVGRQQQPDHDVRYSQPRHAGRPAGRRAVGAGQGPQVPLPRAGYDRHLP